MIVSIETMVRLGFHVLSGHYFGVLFSCICRYTVCTSFILLKIIALQLGMYVDIWHGFYFLNIILILVTDP